MAGVRWAVEMATGKDVFKGKAQDKILKPEQAIDDAVGLDDLEQTALPDLRRRGESKAKALCRRGCPPARAPASARSSSRARQRKWRQGHDQDAKLILVRHETSPEDVGGMWAAQGILT